MKALLNRGPGPRRLLMWTVAAVLAAAGAAHAQDDGTEAITRPSVDVMLSFTRPGRVADVLVKDGQVVSAGQVLVQLDDKVEREQVARLQDEAEETLHVEAAEQNMNLKKVVLARKQKGFEEGVVTVLELEEARVDATISKLSMDLAIFNRELAGRKHADANFDLERMRLASPIDGIVETVVVEAGESVNALDKVARVVNIDPLWIEVPVPLNRAATLSLGQVALVTPERAPADDTSAARGKIIHIAAVADAASHTLMVRVELPNPDARPAGQRVKVTFPAETALAAADTPDTPEIPTPGAESPDATDADTDSEDGDTPQLEESE